MAMNHSCARLCFRAANIPAHSLRIVNQGWGRPNPRLKELFNREIREIRERGAPFVGLACFAVLCIAAGKCSVDFTWIWLDLVGFGWIWLDLVGFGLIGAAPATSKPTSGMRVVS
jgi:hypothetical protein